MLAAGQYYQIQPTHVTTGQPCKKIVVVICFIDVQARGEYSRKFMLKKQWERDGIEIEMTEEDLAPS